MSWRLLARLVLLLAGLVAAGLLIRIIPHQLDPERIGPGPQGAAWFVAAAALGCAAGVPRQAAGFSAGYAFGFAQGMALSLVAQLAGCALDFAWARCIARRWVTCRLPPRLMRVNEVLADRPFRAVLALRLLPLGTNVGLNLAAGVSRLPPGPFLLASAIGYLPQSAIFVLLGSGVRFSGGVQMAVGAGLFVLSLALGLVFLRRKPARYAGVNGIG